MNRLYKFVIYSIGIIAQLTARSAGIGLPDFFEDKVFSFWLGVNPNEINIPEHYSPAWGAIMKASGFLNNLRFFGNYDKSTVERMNEAGDVTFTDRRYDAGRDNIMKLIIQLFPSNTADHVDCLESVWNSPRNLGHFFQQRLESDKPQTLRHLAGLMLRAEVFRLSLNGQNPFIPAIPAIAHPKPVHSFFQKSYKINPPAWAHLGDISDQERDFLTDNFQYLLNKRMGIKGFN
ncbi:MAG: hypothetical protein LBF65_01775, partial [Holosporales bacterium]|nr:hypothetical protein [Holosporales bacterium]